MASLADQLPTIIGVLLGSISTFFATSANGRIQWRREREAHRVAVQMSAYTDHALALKRMADISRAIAAYRGLDAQADPLPLDLGLPRLASAELDRSAKWENLLVVGDPAVIAAAEDWKECVWRLEWFARGRLNGQEEWDRALAAASSAKHKFHVEVRRSIGIPGDLVLKTRKALWLEKELAGRSLEMRRSPIDDAH